MRLWTVQTYDVYKIIQATGSYRCNPKQSVLLQEEEFVVAYKWISKEMKKRIGNPPANVEFPVWAWYKFEGQNRRPDMRKNRVYSKSVLMEIEVPEAQVLLSSFNDWHIVLNDGIIYKANSIPDISDEDWYVETAKEDAYYDSLSREEQLAYKERSWEKVLHTDDDCVQATFWELKKEYIRNIWFLKGFQKK